MLRNLVRANPKKSAAIALALPVVIAAEGLRQRVYLDPINIPTYCVGETTNPDWNRTYSKAECYALLEGRLAEFERGVRSCVTAPLTPSQMAASISLAYNIGTRAYCKSSIARKFNEGDPAGACDAFLLYNRAGGIVWRGLTKRRQVERDLCRS